MDLNAKKSPLSSTTTACSSTPHSEAIAPVDGKSADILKWIPETVGAAMCVFWLVKACWDNPPALVVVGLYLVVEALRRWGGHLAPELASTRVRMWLAVVATGLTSLATDLASGEPFSMSTVTRVLLLVVLPESQPRPADGHAANRGEGARGESGITIRCEEDAAPARPSGVSYKFFDIVRSSVGRPTRASWSESRTR